MNSSPMISQLLKLDTFSSVITLLILFISFTVQKFAFNYLKGEKDQWKFYLSCNIITVASIILVSADSFRLFAFTLLVANLALASLIGLKSKWQEGKSSAIYCLVNFIVAFIFLFIAIEIIKIDSISTINIVGVSTSSAILIIAASNCSNSFLHSSHINIHSFMVDAHQTRHQIYPSSIYYIPNGHDDHANCSRTNSCCNHPFDFAWHI